MSDFFRIPSSLIAEALTLQEWYLFAEIPPSEILDKIGWHEKKKECPGIYNIIQRFRKMSLWVSTTIVRKETREERTACIEKFLEIAHVNKSFFIQ